MPLIPSKLPLYKVAPSDGNPGLIIPKGEKAVFNKASDSHIFDNESRYFIYSIRFQEAGRQITGEVDFIYLDDKYLFFLECKGGAVYYQNGEWWTQGGTIKKDPFEQVCSYLIHFRDRHLNKLGNYQYVINNLILGYGVLFPDCRKPIDFSQSYSGTHRHHPQESIEYELDIVYDSDDHYSEKGFNKYIDRLKEYWNKHGYNNRKSSDKLETNSILSIVRLLKSDLIFEIPILDYFIKDECETKEYTNAQMSILNQIKKNEGFSNIITGGPGTGKTLMALELARHLYVKGKKVLFLCYNKPLATKLKSDLEIILKGEGLIGIKIEVVNIHKFLLNKLTEKGLNIQTQDTKDFWFKILPEAFEGGFKDGSLKEQYDYLIIDEGQDIFHLEIINALEYTFKGGWKGPNWSIFMDKYFQSVYGDFNKELYDIFENEYRPYISTLDCNCRNAPKIIEKSHFHTGVEQIKCLKNDYLNPIVEYYNSEIDFINKLNNQVSQLNKQNISQNDITILVPNKLIDKIILSSTGKYIGIGDSYLLRNDKIKISTPSMYKGLENKVIIIGGFSDYDPNDKQLMSELYVGYTRATTLLIILFPKSKIELLNKFVQETITKTINHAT